MTNTVQREHARDRQQHSMSTGSHTPRVKGRRSRSADDVNNVTGSAAPYTRSSTRPLNKDMCFFCQTDNDQKLFTVRTGNAGQSLKQAVQASSDPELKTRYSSCIADGDAHAMDIQYHKACWTKHVFREHICQHVTFGWNRGPGKSFTCLHQAMVERHNPF